ncbi:hypothetical protein IWX81_001441 [Salinibacterium sp. CAN_S4]|uniref:hypothetical protein n=1 Tax=Salinibacterium sp. CAN_S4 TaxID=2787727 RepID=UPI0018F04C71
MTLQQLDGNPSALAARADSLSASAQAIQDAAEALFALSFAGSGDALEVVAERADEAAGKIKDAHRRYDGTATALVAFAVELGDAHRKADAIINESHADQNMAAGLEGRMTELGRTREQLDASSPGDPRLDDIDDTMRQLASRRSGYESQANDAISQLAQLRRDVDAAAERAMARIDDALDSTNDSLRDKVGDFLDRIGDFLAVVAKWIADVLATIIKAILIVVLVLVALVLVVVAIALILAWLALVAPLLLILGRLLLLSFLIPGMDQWRTQLLAILVSVAFPLVGALLLWRVLSDVLAPDPKVTPLDPADIEKKEQKKAQAAADDVAGLYSLKDYADAEGYTDGMGGEDRSVVDIRKVVGPDGVERWVVTLPSTQDWVAKNGDTAATNDLDSNLALMLTPELKTQYERAVLDAMAQAGIGPDDPVMLVGFSQGGIMAGHLAANRSDAYNFEAVFVYGAPIDAMDIPESTKVLSIQHTGDVVPTLDLTNPKPNTPNHVTVSADANDGTIGVSSHNNSKYSETAAHSPALDPYQHFFDDFSGAVTEQHQYTWQE